MRFAPRAIVLPLLLLTAPPTPRATEIGTNDNRTPAGVLRDGVLAVDLVAAAGTWYPELDEGPGHDVYAFGERGHGLTNPGPLLRVPAGTAVHATVRNQLPGDTLTVHGLHDRPGTPAPLRLAPGASVEVTLRLARPGTYFYWGTTRAARTLRERWGAETQLIGAIVVDTPGVVPDDHVFVIGLEDDSAATIVERKIHAAVVNGRSWPHSTIHTVTVGDSVRMRWINGSGRMHPMHLHGFYFRVDRRGDMAVDTLYDAASRRLVATELMPWGTTMSLTWVPERPGNWLFHCHMAEHMSPHLRRGVHRTDHSAHDLNHTLDVMAGLVTGWRVRPSDGAAALAYAPASAPRRLRLFVQSAPGRYGEHPALGFVLQTDDAAPAPDSVVIPGPPLVLVRGEPVEITVVNRLDEPTSIHWHGIELESYYDGVSGWSGEEGRTAPAIAPRDSFIARFTPPRAGTFIYHSHFDEARQLSSGVYGAIVVLETGQVLDAGLDRLWILSKGGPAPGPHLNLNGTRSPVIDFEAGKRYRIRLINIHPNAPVELSLLADSVPVRWRALAKDGAELPARQAQPRPALVTIGVGEVYDYEFAPEAPAELRLRATGPTGVPHLLTGVVRVSAARP